MKIFRVRPLVLGTSVSIAAAGMSLVAATPSRATTPAVAKSARCPSYAVTYYGSRGNCAKLAQQLLIKHHYSVGAAGADGVFGAATRTAVKKFQSARHLNPTGVVDDLTWKALLRFGSGGSACVNRTYDEMTVPQRLGQLIMVGMTKDNQSTVHRLVSTKHVGNVIYLGGWSGDSTVGKTSDGLQRHTSNPATDGVGLLIGADQEGGYVQQLTGTGFTRLPTALTQGGWSSSKQRSQAASVGQQLRNVGVNVNLAPVSDTVPKSKGTKNGPIGHYYREYGYTTSTVSRGVTNVVHGLNSRGEIATLKHFPGIGRITNNTDTSSTGITDNTMTSTDAYLSPFKSGISAGAGMVMVGLAKYPKIDSANPAPFSSKVLTTMLRKNLGFNGVVVSDSMSAVAVKQVPAGDRATRFIAAGGDLVLTGSTADVPTMLAAIRAEVSASPAFAKQVNASIHRILTLKEQHGMLFCR